MPCKDHMTTKAHPARTHPLLPQSSSFFPSLCPLFIHPLSQCQLSPFKFSLQLHSGLQIAWQETLIVGETATLNCSSDLDVTMTEWWYSGAVVVSSTGPRAELIFNPVRDTFHSRRYSCRVTSPYGVQEQTIITIVEGKLMFLQLGWQLGL